MKAESTGVLLRPLSELDAEIEQLQAYEKRLQLSRDLRLRITRLQTDDLQIGLMAKIVEIVCAVRKVPVYRVYERGRPQIICDTRFMIFYIARKHTRLSLQLIASPFGMDHGSVINGLVRAAELLTADRNWATELRAAEQHFVEQIGKLTAENLPV